MSFFERLRADTEIDRQDLLAVRIIQDALQGRIELAQYTAFLAQAYHHVRHTVPLLMACGSRLPPRLSWLQAAVADYISEEIGHDDWILADLAACNVDTERVRASDPAFDTEVMVAYAYHQIDRGDPLAFFGMVHVLEGTSVAIADRAASALRASLALPESAFRYLRSHGTLDVGHVQNFACLMDRLVDASDQAAVMNAARRFYRLYGNVFRALPAPASPSNRGAV
jgi:pyrroloquinoline quinone (PQQ) biosynthesis protein C